MDQGKELIKLALFGQPVRSSLSPAIHRRFADQFGLQINYQLVETGGEGFPAALEAFRLAGGSRLQYHPAAQAGSMAPGCSGLRRGQPGASGQYTRGSTIEWLVRPHHRWCRPGVLTWPGIMRLELVGQRILILGAGGATAGILGRLLAENPQQVVLVNRNLDRAQAAIGTLWIHWVGRGHGLD